MAIRNSSIMIVHHGFETISGGEKILLTLIDELIKKGFKVSTVTAWDYKIKDRYISLKVKKYYGLRKRVPRMTLFQRTILFNRALSKALKKERPKVVWTDCEWAKELEKYQDGCVIAYYHMPPDIRIKNGTLFKFRKWLVEKYLTQLHEIADISLCNSMFTQERLKKIGINARILYPPVKPIKTLKKVKQAITIGRLIPAKRHEIAILIAKKANLPIKVLGWRYWGDLNYFNYLQSLCNEQENAFLISDADDKVLNEEIGKSLIYLHCNPNEDFGISVVEAMSAKCIPIVYANGGPWTDIIQEGKYGFGFKEPDEAVEKIKEILKLDNETLSELRSKVKLRAYNFHESIFRRNVTQLIERLL